MSDDLKLDTLVQRVSYLFDAIPESRNDKLLLVLCYWKIFDEVDIPDWLIQDIIAKASSPESINRIGRKVLSYQQLHAIIASVQETRGNDIGE